jgi:hypothetical protein
MNFRSYSKQRIINIECLLWVAVSTGRQETPRPDFSQLSQTGSFRPMTDIEDSLLQLFVIYIEASNMLTHNYYHASIKK